MKKVNEVKDVIDVIKLINVLENKIFVVFNDLIGKGFFDEIVYNFWKKYEGDLEVCLKKFKLLLFCRKCV